MILSSSFLGERHIFEARDFPGWLLVLPAALAIIGPALRRRIPGELFEHFDHAGDRKVFELRNDDICAAAYLRF